MRDLYGDVSRVTLAAPQRSLTQHAYENDRQIIAGCGRAEAAKLLGITTVLCLRISRLSDAEKRAYILADNRLAEVAGLEPRKSSWRSLLVRIL